jgi:hypothetical protein
MITLAVFWGIWAAFICAVMMVDRTLSKRDDFSSPLHTYFVLAAITPFLMLPVYFYSAHRSSSSGVRWGLTLAGLPLTAICWLFACYHLGLYVSIARCLFA